jgi:ribonuclease Z
LSTVLDAFSRYIIAWKLCPTMKAEDVTTTLNLALKASGLRKRQRAHINVWRNKVEAMGLSIGPWLRAFKQATLRGAPDDTLIEVAWRDRSSDTAAFLPLAVSKWRS